jgi:hypothetical protein
MSRFDSYTTPPGIKGTDPKSVDLPANAFNEPDPDPDAYSCTVSSAGLPVVWKLENIMLRYRWYYEWAPDMYAYKLALRLDNSALPWLKESDAGGVEGEWRRDISEGKDINNWSNSWPLEGDEAQRNKANGDPYNFEGWRMTYDPEGRVLNLTNSWFCDDKNIDQP